MEHILAKIKEFNTIIIHDSDKMGLSQLYQLRGRVGRGDKKSYCILVTENKSEKNLNRLKILSKTKRKR